ncbi:MAG: hypothetical protein ACJA2D_001108, partial [Pseudohongiellaceae bacterium]
SFGYSDKESSPLRMAYACYTLYLHFRIPAAIATAVKKGRALPISVNLIKFDYLKVTLTVNLPSIRVAKRLFVVL